MLTFQHYTSELLEMTTEYRRRGREEARDHRPPSDALHPDQNETSLRSQAEGWLDKEQSYFDQSIAEVSKTVSGARQQLIMLDVSAQQLMDDNSLDSTINALMAEERSSLILAAESRIRAMVDWQNFRDANNISVQASYPDSHIWHFAIVVAAALIETLVNAFFYENAQGLLGGFFVALGVSMLNMGGALVLGIGFRLKNLWVQDKKVFGWLCLILFLVLSIYCNALFSSFRAEYQVLQNPTDSQQLREAFAASMAEAKHIFVLDLHIADFMSFILFGFGLLLSGLAFWKGYTFDDRHPGYSKLDRKLMAARKFEQEKQYLFRQRIKNYLDERCRDVNLAREEPNQLAAHIASSKVNLLGAKSKLKQQTAAIQRDYKTVLDAYRDANVRVRGTDPPSYFRTIDDLTVKVSDDSASGVQDEIDLFQEEIGPLRDRIQKPLGEKLQEMSLKSAKVLSTEYDVFLRDVDTQAKDNITRSTIIIHRAS